MVPDGSWSGNLYDFFRRVIQRLTADLKVPFVLRDGARIDDTPVHQAVREALVNCLIHADYTDRASVLVVKSPAGFSFRNPGMMRLPVAQALHGGASDCRNRTLHQMFLLINLGERAGSGLPKIPQRLGTVRPWAAAFDSAEPFDHTVLRRCWGHLVPTRWTKLRKKLPEETSGRTSSWVLALLRQSPALSARQLAALLGMEPACRRTAIGQAPVHRLKRHGPTRWPLGGIAVTHRHYAF